MTSELQKQLIKLYACAEAVEWVGDRTLEQAWAECERGDYMLWLAGRVVGDAFSDSRRPLVLAACECARLTLEQIPEGEARPRVAIETAERWARGEDVSREELQAANAAAHTAALAAPTAANSARAARAAYAAGGVAYAYAAGAHAAWTAYAAGAVEAAAGTRVADYAANAAGAAEACVAEANGHTAGAAQRAVAFARCAGIVRKHYPAPPVVGRS